MNEYGAMVEWWWQGKTEVQGEEHFPVCVVDEWVSMEHWWYDTDREKVLGGKPCLWNDTDRGKVLGENPV